jgi:hypothetical protein
MEVPDLPLAVLLSEVNSISSCHGLDKLWKWNVVCFGMFVMNNGALRAVKKLYICLCAARDTSPRPMRFWRPLGHGKGFVTRRNPHTLRRLAVLGNLDDWSSEGMLNHQTLGPTRKGIAVDITLLDAGEFGPGTHVFGFKYNIISSTP